MLQFVKRKIRQILCNHPPVVLSHWSIDPKKLPGWSGMKCNKCGKEWTCFRSLQIPCEFKNEER